MAHFSVERKLRQYTRHPTMGGDTKISQSLLDEAADEIERLRKELAAKNRLLNDYKRMSASQ